MKIHEYNEMMAYLTRPARTGFNQGTSFNRNPVGINQYTKLKPARTLVEIQAIIDNAPTIEIDGKFFEQTAKDLQGTSEYSGKELITRKEHEKYKDKLKYKSTGKRKIVSPNQTNIKRYETIKKVQGSNISMIGSGQTGKQFSHVYPLIESVKPGTQTTFKIDAKMNRKLEGYNRIGQNIAEEQELLIKTKPEGYKKKIVELNARAKKNVMNAVQELGKEYKGQIGYFQVDPDTGEFKPKSGNYKMSFAGIEGKNEIYKEMTGKERKNFERKISKIKKPTSALSELASRTGAGVDPVLLAKAGYEEAIKPAARVAGKVLAPAVTPLGAGAIWGATGFDKESAMDRATLGAEAAFAPELVKMSSKVTKPIQNQTMRSIVRGVLNAGMPLKWAMRAARIASPIGWATLGAEGIYQLGKYAINEHKRFKALSPEEQAAERAEQEEAAQFSAAEGGRVGLKKGTPKSPSRRAFIKGVTALAALPIVGKYFKLGKVLGKTKPYYGPVIEKIKGMPEWFPSLVKKLWNEGEDVTKTVAYKERQVVKRGTLEGGDDVDMIYDLDTGDVSIDVTPKKGKYETSSGAYNKEYSLDYKKGQQIEEGKHAGKTEADDFGVTELEGRMDPNAMDIDWDANYTTVDDAMSDLTELEGFAKSKSTKQIHKKKGTKPKDVFPDYDPGDYDY